MNMIALTASPTATRLGIKEQFTPPAEVVENATLLWNKIISRLPIAYTVNSWYRCERLNKAVGGSKTSDHTLGRSIDLDSQNNANNRAIFQWIKDNCEFDQLIWEFGNDDAPDWVHVSYRKNGCRNQVLRAVKNAQGRTTYKPM